MRDQALTLDRPLQAVLFICSHNSVRSPMASELLKWRTGRRIYVRSCGVKPEEVDPFAASVMDELGLDILHHKPTHFDDLEDSSFDVIVTLSPPSQHFAMELTRTMDVDVIYWPTLDATKSTGSREIRLDSYRDVRKALDANIQSVFAEWVTTG